MCGRVWKHIALISGAYNHDPGCRPKSRSPTTPEEATPTEPPTWPNLAYPSRALLFPRPFAKPPAVALPPATVPLAIVAARKRVRCSPLRSSPVLSGPLWSCPVLSGPLRSMYANAPLPPAPYRCCCCCCYLSSPFEGSTGGYKGGKPSVIQRSLRRENKRSTRSHPTVRSMV